MFILCLGSFVPITVQYSECIKTKALILNFDINQYLGPGNSDQPTFMIIFQFSQIR